MGHQSRRASRAR